MEKVSIISEHSVGQRLDVFCTILMSGYSRSSIQKAIKEEKVTVNSLPAKARQIVKLGDRVAIQMEDKGIPAITENRLMNIHIVHEDRDVVVINKPAGIAVHAGVGIPSGTIADWFAARYPNAVGVGEHGRSGVVHRLDKDTSGILILAKSETAFLHLKKQFQIRRPKKEYLALVFGVPGGKDGRITKPIARSRRNPMRRAIDEAGKESATEWAMEKKFGTSFALLRVFPFTGRMHQIRVHLHHIGHPIVGDQLYAFKRKKQPAGARRQMLHAEKLTVLLPSEKTKTFIAPMPEDMAEVIHGLSPQMHHVPESSI